MTFPRGRLVGYIVPPKEDLHNRNMDENSENEEDDEVEKQPEFLDISEMDAVGSGESVYKSAAPPQREVEFMVSQRKLRVLGRFALSDPWWEITCTVQKKTQKIQMTGYPAYKLRTTRSIVPLFLTACGVAPNLVTEFMTWLPENRQVELPNLQEALMEFTECNQALRKAAEYAICLISKSDAGFYVRAASLYPGFMKYMPALLPGRFLDLLKKGKEQERKGAEEAANSEASSQKPEDRSLLSKLEKLIQTDVWKFGFGYIMHNEFNLIRCEAKTSDFKDSGLFKKLKPEQQNALLVYEKVKSFCRKQGHTYIYKERLEEMMRCEKMREESIWEAVGFLRKEGVLVVEGQRVALRNLYKYETEITSCLHTLMTKEPWKIELDVKEVLLSAQRDRLKAKAGKENGSISFNEEPEPTIMDLDADQVRAAEVMCSKPVTVISGKGGCGKTTVVSMIFKAAMELQKSSEELHSTCEKSEDEHEKPKIEVLLTAPTGRAASLLTLKTSFPAYTLHQIMWSYMTVKKNEKGEPMNWKFASVRVLVVDEGSLVCVQILHSILTILTEHAQLQKFILLGDVRQLPSIEPGNVLNDLFDRFRRVGCAIEMRTNHRAESELIVHNAGLIAEMGAKRKYKSLKFDAVVHLGEPFTMPSSDKRFILISLPSKNSRDDDLQNAIKQLLQGPAPGLEDDKTSQFVAFKRTECNLINELCCKHYSGHVTKTHKKKLNFQKGDKVCCTKNGYISDIAKEEQRADKRQDKDLDGGPSLEQNGKERLCNGEIFFIREDITEEEVGKSHSKKRYLTLDDGHGRMLVADFRELNKECKLQHAWSRTIHTFQGSEAETIVYVLGDGRGHTWNHVYTAVTRGQKRVYVIVKEDGLKNAIEGVVIKRRTRLSTQTPKLVCKSGITRTQASTQMTQPHLESSNNASRIQSCQPSQPPSIQPGLPQAAFNIDDDGQNHGIDFGNFNMAQSDKSSPYKRQSGNDVQTTPSKHPKIITRESPLGCTQMQRLSLGSDAPKPSPRQLFSNQQQSQQNE